MDLLISTSDFNRTFKQAKKKKKVQGPEHAFQKEVLAHLKRNGFLPIRFNSQVGKSSATGTLLRGYMIYGLGMSSGLPDILAIKNGRSIFIEVKSPKGRLSDDQKKVHAELEKYKFPHTTVKSIPELDAQLLSNGFDLVTIKN
jgi:hypothetical protein